MAKTVKRPQYKMYEDTDYMTRNRELNTNAYGQLDTALGNLGSFDQNYMQALAGDYSQAAWNDLNRGYQQAVNQNLARNYNRLGTTGSSSGLYQADSQQRTYNDMATRLASNTAQYYDTLINNNLNRQLQQLQAYNNLFKQSGDITENKDWQNYLTYRTNLDNQYLNDVDKKNYWKNMIGNSIQGSMQGAAQGMMTGNPWVAVGMGVAGGVGGALGTQTNSSQLANGINTYNAMNAANNQNAAGINLGGYGNNQNYNYAGTNANLLSSYTPMSQEQLLKYLRGN